MQATAYTQEAVSALDEETVTVLDYDVENQVAVIDILECDVDELERVSHRVDAVMPVEDAIQHSGEYNWIIDAEEADLSTQLT